MRRTNVLYGKRELRVIVITMMLLGSYWFSGPTLNASASESSSDEVPLPHTFKLVWLDQALDDSWMTLQKEYGFQGIAKIVGAGEWTNVESTEGIFDFSSLKRSLENAWEHGFWVMPTLGLNDPPSWFIEKFPNSILEDATGQTITDYNEGGHVLSPWFVMSQEGDYYIKRFVEKYLETISEYPNTVGVFVGDHLVFNLPWYLGKNPPLKYFMCFDEYALKSYKENLGDYPYPNPPQTYDELVSRGSQFMKEFEQWYRESAVLAIEKYLGWIGGKVKYKTINVGRVGNEADNYMIGTTVYQVKQVFDAMSQFNCVIENFEALQDTDRAVELSIWAKERGLIFGGEPYTGVDAPSAEMAVDNLIKVGGPVLFHIDQTFGILNENMIKKIKEFNDQFPSVQAPRAPTPASLNVKSHSLVILTGKDTIDEGSEFEVHFIIENLGEKTAENVMATIQLPPVLTTTESVAYTIGELLGQSSETIGWRIKATKSGTFTIGLSVSSTTAETATYSIDITVRAPGCIIATATYGSELAPEVQFLRGFRDSIVLSTFAGSQFMLVFNAWYYSFSPPVADFIAQQPVVKTVMKVVLYPLIGILHLSSMAYSLFAFSPELGVVIAGLMASFLIGVVYFTPPATLLLLVIKRLWKKTLKTKQLKLLTIPWLTSLALTLLGEITASPTLMMVATVSFVLTTLASSATVAANKIAQRFP